MEKEAPMGEFEFLPPTSEELDEDRRLEEFRDKIMAIAASEEADAKTKKAGRSGHFLGVKLERHRIPRNSIQVAEKIYSGEVTLDDITIGWKKIKDEYDAEIAAGVWREPFPETPEHAVMEFLANKATVVVGRRQLEEIKRARQSLQ